MSDPHTTHQPVATPATVTRIDRPSTPVAPTPLHPAEIPPGVQIVTLPGGVRTLAYTQPTQPAPATPVPTAQPLPTWVKSTALLSPTVGGGIALAGIGLGFAAPALWAGAALIAACALALMAARGRRTTHITQNITANGTFSRATGHTNLRTER